MTATARPTAFGETLREMRVRRHMSDTDVAALCRLDRSLISRYQSGERFPPPWTVATIADALCRTTTERRALYRAAGYVYAKRDDQVVRDLEALLDDDTLPPATRDDVRAAVAIACRLAVGSK